MQVLSALWVHVLLVLRLKHHGHGLPSSVLGASFLVAAYLLCNVMSAGITAQLSAQTLFGLCLVSGSYVFYLRNHVIGLLILISIISNVLALLCYWQFGENELSRQVLTALEYVLMAGALMNLIKKETTAI